MRQLSVNETNKKGCFSFLLKWVLSGVICYFIFNIYPLTLIGLIFNTILYFGIWKGIPMLIKYLSLNFSILPKTINKEQFSINGETTILNPYTGMFISGGAGSGKSKSLIEPLIKEAGKKGFTGVVYDFKFPELAQYVERAYENSDIKTYYLNFEDLKKSNRINPIAPELMTKEAYAREFAYTILINLNPHWIKKPDFWSDNAISILTAVFWYLREKHPKQCTLPHAVNMILGSDIEKILKVLSTEPKCKEMLAPILTAWTSGAQEQLSGALSSTQVSLNKINFDEMYYLLSDSNVDLRLNDSENKGILCIGNNPQLAEAYGPIIGLIMTSISKQLNRQGKEKSIFLVDEFPTIYIPNVEQLPATARSNKVSTILACQDIAQITDKYGKEKTETILSNLGNQFYGRTPNPDTAKRVTEIFGKDDKIVISKSKKIFDFNSQSETVSTRETNIVKTQDVANLDTGSFFTILSEGTFRQGISHIPMDKKFTKKEIQDFNFVDERDIKNAYNRIKLEVERIILK